MTFTTFASSSTGNAALVSCGSTHILLDAGISAKQIVAGLRALGTSPRELAAILITHAHSDHVSGLRVLAGKAGAPIYATEAAFREWYRRNRCDEVKSLFHPLEVGESLQIGPVRVEPFPTSHDTAGSVGYSITGDGRRMVLCTDLGYVSSEVRQAVEGCDLLVCETNHDEAWLRTSQYPYPLKRRISGPYGHLSNAAGAELATFAVATGAKAVMLAHLSQNNNTPQLAYEAVALRLQEEGYDPEGEVSITVAPAYEMGPTITLGEEVAVC